MEQLFFEVALIIIVATIFGYLSKLVKQPLIPAYILTGLLIGPFGFGLITDPQFITTFSEIGIAFLLFVVGLELDFKRLRDIGLVASVGGTVQIFLLFGFGYLVAVLSNAFSQLELVYIGMILAFSSTMVVVKLLSDKKVLDTLHGRITIGILLMQDIFAILALSTLTTLNSFSLAALFYSILKAVVIFVGAVVISRYVFPPVFKLAAQSQEILFLLSITTCFVFSIVANVLGFSIAIGGFIAGVTLANLPYNIEIISRIKPLRDFFATLFFVSLGMELLFRSFGKIVVPFLVFLFFIVMFKPFIIMLICSLFGYTRRTSFLSAISLAQMSEFSLIIVAQGLALGHISPEIFSLAVVLAVTTIISTTYFIKYDNVIYAFLSDYLRVFDKIADEGTELQYTNDRESYEVILIGFDRIAYSIAKTLKRMGKSWLVVDFNPDIIKRLVKEKINCLYGDIGDIEIIERLNIKDAEIIISTIPDKQDNLLLLQKVKQVNEKATILVTANKVEEALELYDQGADYVILPHFLGGDHVSIILEEVTPDINKVINTKLRHIEELNLRRELGHEHPHHNYRKNEH